MLQQKTKNEHIIYSWGNRVTEQVHFGGEKMKQMTPTPRDFVLKHISKCCLQLSCPSKTNTFFPPAPNTSTSDGLTGWWRIQFNVSYFALDMLLLTKKIHFLFSSSQLILLIMLQVLKGREAYSNDFLKTFLSLLAAHL